MDDPLLLARIQFAANITFHILFPALSIALGWLLLFFKLRFRATGDAVWMALYRFWVKIFALSFALGVVSGITMSFQFGTNWPGFMEKVGNIAGPLLAYEVLTAFFMEATFLAIMLFGMNRVSERVHTLATALVWLVERTDMPLRGLVRALVILPIAVPPVLLAIGWTMLLSPRIGFLNGQLQDLLGLEQAPFDPERPA